MIYLGANPIKNLIIIVGLYLLALLSGCMCGEEALKFCLNHNDANGALAAAKLMVASGANVNMKTTRDFTPLHIAAGADDVEFAELLISKGADVNAKIDNGDTPINFAICSSGHNGSTKMVELLLKHGADINSNSKLESPLMGACKYSYYDIVKYLVEQGADINLTSGSKAPALLYSDDKRIIELLVSKGADVNAKNLSGDTLLMSIVRNGKSVAEKKESILFLVERGVNINATYQSGIYDIQTKTALDEAILSTQPEEIIALLRSKGAKTATELKAEKPVPAPNNGK
ncbi:MAG: ankyrin repeat domain-containing protein [Victivallales bacterium]|jgi:cytohesin